MSFGKPAKYGKFYPGRLDDTAVNHDLLWRARISQEIDMMEELEAREHANAPWDDRSDRMLYDAILVHGDGAWDSIAADPKFTPLARFHSAWDMKRRWQEVQRSGVNEQDLRIQRAMEAASPDIDPTGGITQTLSLQKALSQTQIKLNSTQRRLAAERHARFEAEKRAAKEARAIHALRTQLESRQSKSHGRSSADLPTIKPAGFMPRPLTLSPVRSETAFAVDPSMAYMTRKGLRAAGATVTASAASLHIDGSAAGGRPSTAGPTHFEPHKSSVQAARNYIRNISVLVK